MTSRLPLQLSYLAALLAVMLLSLAGVRSNVMQASMSARASMPECGMERMHMGGSRKGAPTAPAKSCSYCAVAAHAPALTIAQPFAAPSAIAWCAWPPLASLGPRGPPELEPRSRSPPNDLLTA